MNENETAETIEEDLKRRLEEHFLKIGLLHTNNDASSAFSKEEYRRAHEFQRKDKYQNNLSFIQNNYTKLIKYFASGDEIDVENINPKMELIKAGTSQSDLFRLATLYWRVPVSIGYGRRMRFLVWDKNNGKLLGIIGMGDAVFNLKVRDQLIGWDHIDRKKSLVNLMDAHVLGALPPYNMLLGGKLVACLIRTREVASLFKAKYDKTKGIISGENKNARLVAVTTSSALGRSSIYNRLAIGGLRYFEPIGYTSGWGHFHIPNDLFEQMRLYLRALGDPYASNHSFGQGPNWRLRTVRKALGLLGLDENYVRHGLLREVFICKMATNAFEVLKGTKKRPIYTGLLTVNEVSALAKKRWMIPRSRRRKEYLRWEPRMLHDEIIPARSEE